MRKRLVIILSMMFVFFLTGNNIVQATSNYIVGASVDMPDGVTASVPIDSVTSQASAVQSMINTINNGGHVVIAGGTGGSVSASMVQQVVAGALQNTGGSITIVAGLNNDETVAMMKTYLSNGIPYSTQGTGNQTPDPGSSTYGYPAGFTGTTTTAYNWGASLLDSMAPGNTTGGFLNWSAPVAPVIVTPPAVYVPLPSIVGSINQTTAYPGQVLTLTATLGSSTSSGKAKDTLGTTVSIPASGSYSYTIPTNATIGQDIDIRFYCSNQWVTDFSGNFVEVYITNPMTLDTSANPSTLAPTELSALTATTTGFANKVSAIAKPVLIDGTKNTIAAGSYHTLTVHSDNTVWSSGYNNAGQLGNGTVTEQHLAVQVQGLTNVVSVSAGDMHSLALKSDGTVFSWGYDNNGELGNGTTGTNSTIPVQVQGLTNIVSISSGGYHNLALSKDGTVFAWGYNGHGELGNGNTSNSSTPIQVNGISNVTSIGTGCYHSLAVTYDGKVYSWGYNGYGELGDGTNISRTTPTQVIGITNAKTVTGGYGHSVLQKIDNSLFSWGWNAYGQLGNGTYTDSNVPVAMNGGTGLSICAGGYNTEAIGPDNVVYSTGYNGDGQLGNGNNSGSNTWVSTGLTSTLRIGSGSLSRTTLAITADSLLHVWGDNTHGEFASNGTTNSNAPTSYANFNIATISGSICLKPDGTVWSVTYGYPNTSTQFTELGNTVVKISYDKGTADLWWAVQSDGTLWKHTPEYTTNHGDTVHPAVLAIYPLLSNIVDISSGCNGTGIAKKADGTVWTLSNGSQVAGISNVTDISGGYSFNLALKSDGTVWYWGNMQAWNGNSYNIYLADTAVPTKIAGITNIAQISAGTTSAMFLNKTGTVYTLGQTTYGNGLYIFKYNTPTAQVGMPSIKSIYAGWNDQFAVGIDGTFYGWGMLFPGKYSPIACTNPYRLGAYSAYNSSTNTYDESQIIYSADRVVGEWLIVKTDGTISYSQNVTFMYDTQMVSLSGFNLNSAQITYSLGSLSAYAPLNVNFTPTDNTYPASNTWNGSVQIPTNAPIYSQYVVTVTSQSPWQTDSGQTQAVTQTLLLNVQNTIKLSQPAVTKINGIASSSTMVHPGDQVTVSMPSTGYALAVGSTGVDPTGVAVMTPVSLSPSTSIASIPKINTWTGTIIIPANAPVNSYTITFIGTNTTFVNQRPSEPVYLNLVVGTPPVYITGQPTAVPDPVYSHRDGQNIVTISVKTQNNSSTVKNVPLSVSGTMRVNGTDTPFTTVLANMSSSDNTNWSELYPVPDNVPEGTVLTFSVSVVAQTGYIFGPVKVATSVSRYLVAKGKVSAQTAAPGSTISLNGSTTDGHASSLKVTDSQMNSVNLSTADTSLGSNSWNGNYTIPNTAKIGQTLTLTWTPTDTVSGTNFTGIPDQKTITVTNTPQILGTVFNQVSPYPSATTGAPTGTVDAIILTKGWVTSLNVSWDTSYSIPSTSHVDIDSNGTRQWTIKNLTVPANADVSNAVLTLLNIQAKTSFIDQSTGNYQVVTGKAILPIANKIVTTAQQLANPVVLPGTPFTITVKTTGFATSAYAKKLDGTWLTLSPSSSVSPTIPYSNTFTGSFLVPNGTTSQVYDIPVYATNKAPSNPSFINQPDSNTDYISINIGGVPSIFSAYLSPYEIDLPAAIDADRTVTLNAQTTGQVSGVQISLSINGGAATILPAGTMTATSGTVPGLVSWQGAYLVDPSTADGTKLTFTFQAKDAGGTPTGPTITPHYVTIVQTRPPLVIITH